MHALVGDLDIDLIYVETGASLHQQLYVMKYIMFVLMFKWVKYRR